ncbi:metallophosphoesterase [Streptomyces sp. NBC_00249]|uniref:metallophosphoesterase n=1 Tax=Streptomyces sp. NBC_00249 TaxID=2975690 RepID=UPI00224E76A2|nr:metallophosphoesterase [Streptomyces sp. NBC_00249]MCX5194864.1 metallophosphoesterase [Streptomyces sp. NBC_00249]
MTVFVVIAAVLAALVLVGFVHRWLWIRLVRDTTRAGGAARRAGTVLAFALPLLALAALTAGRAGAPFWLERLVAWPGYMWLAVLLYLTLAMLVAEPARHLWLRRLARRAPQSPEGLDSGSPAAGGTAPAGEGGGAGQVPARVGTAAGPAPQSPEGLEFGSPAAGAGVAGAGAEPQVREGAGRGTAPQGPDGVSRRVFVSRVVGGAAALAAGGVVANGTYGVLRGPRVKRVTVPLARLPRAAHGFRIAVVSDVHLGPILGRAHTDRIVATINRTQPDLVAIVGDLVDGDVRDLGPAAEPLRGLSSRLGSYFVTGNHEYFSGAQQWVDHVRELGLVPLENARRELPYFDLAGVNDVQGESEGHGPDFGAALGDRDRSRASVLLAHQPIVIDEAVRHGVDLQLSGHTHGGQLWPGKYLAELANPTVAGLERYGDTQLYVSRGAGAWGPPVRVGAPSDITVVELASYQA